MRKDRSRAIYSELINGKFINKTEFKNGQIVDNPLFDEIANEANREKYIGLYESIGFELKQLGDSFFINELHSGNDGFELSEMSARIQGVIVILTRGITQEHLASTVIVNSAAGISKAYLKKFAENEEFIKILQAIKGARDLMREVENSLVTRNIAYWNDRDNLVLSDSGIAILEHMLLSVQKPNAAEGIYG